MFGCFSVPIHEVGEHQGQHFFSMDLIEGGTLGEHLPCFTAHPRAAARLLAAVARAVHHAHQRQLLHRDLKPANILLERKGDLPVEQWAPHVTDFGLAKRVTAAAGPEQAASGIIGTPTYMAPEQAAGRAGLTTAVDVYSLGAILYEVLTGRPPFQAAATMDVLLQILESEPLPPRAVNPRADRDLEVICLKCLRKDPGRRYGSAEALADDLERWLSDQPIRARPVAAWERMARWARRRPVVAALAAVIVAVSALGLGGVLWQWQQTESALTKSEEAQRAEAFQKHQAETARTQAQDSLEDANRNLYFNRLARAQLEWLVNDDMQQAEKALDSCDKGLRGWEWHYMKRLCRGGLRTFRGHTDSVECVAYSPDGKTIASASMDKTVKVWNVSAGQLVFNLTGHTGPVYCVAFSPDGKTLASGSTDQTIKVWDASSGNEVQTLRGHRIPVLRVAFSPDGKRLASVGGTGGREKEAPPTMYNQGTGQFVAVVQPLLEPLKENRTSHNQGGRQDADGEAKVWDLAAGQAILALSGHSGSVTGIAFRADGKRLATSSRDGTAKVWDAMAGKETLTFRGHNGSVTSVAFSPDGKHIASTSMDRTVRIWDANTGQEQVAYRGHQLGVHHAAFSPDGQRVASGNPLGFNLADPWGDNHPGKVKVWEATTGREIFTLRGHGRSVTGVAFSPDGTRLVSASADGTVKLWDAVAGPEASLLATEPSRPTPACRAFSPDGKHLASAFQDRTVKVWEAGNGQNVITLTGHTGQVTSLAFSPDGKYLASGAGEVKLWDAATGRETITLAGVAPDRNGLAFSPDSGKLISRGPNEKVTVRDAATGVNLWTFDGPPGEGSGVALSPDGVYLAAAASRTDKPTHILHPGDAPNVEVLIRPNDVIEWISEIRVWDTQTGRHVQTWRVPRHNIKALAFGRDGKVLATGGGDGTVRLWDVTTGEQTRVIEGHFGSVLCVAFSPDGTRIATGTGSAETVKVWDSRTGAEALTLRGNASAVIGIAFSPDGNRLFCLLADQTVKVWDGTPLPIDSQ
jgi:WD40 repeat protein